MKYFIDTEFIEGTQKESFPINLFRKNSKPTIDLISIGIVAEDGREYYAISKDFNLKEAWNRYDEKPFKSTHKEDEGKILTQRIYWIRENVLKPIWEELVSKDVEWYKDMWKRVPSYSTYHPKDHYFTYKNLKRLLNKYGKTNKQIAEEVKGFCLDDVTVYKSPDGRYTGGCDPYKGNPEFYAYYADYDWVAFCWLFGNMIDLPKGFPMYCVDLKQELDSKVNNMELKDFNALRNIPNSSDFAFRSFSIDTFDKKLELIKCDNTYPKQTNEHNALADAKWNKALYEFLNSLK